MEAGDSFQMQWLTAVHRIAEPIERDIDGWDASVKVAALATVLMGKDLKPAQVDRQGIRGSIQLRSNCPQQVRMEAVCRKTYGERRRSEVAPELSSGIADVQCEWDFQHCAVRNDVLDAFDCRGGPDADDRLWIVRRFPQRNPRGRERKRALARLR